MNETTRTPIKLRKGGKKQLAAIMGVSEMTVWRAVHYKYDTATAEQIRRNAFLYNLVKIY